jgi:glucuronosyltransferase
LTETSLTWGLAEVLNNKKYTEKVKELSRRFRDKPQHPVDLAKYYVEYVMRHKGAPFMQSSSTYLSFIELNNLDVYAIIGVILFLIIYLPSRLIRSFFKCLCGGGAVESSKKRKVKSN